MKESPIVDPAALTSAGWKLPYPLPTDPVSAGAAAIQSLAQAVEQRAILSPLVVIPILGQRSTGNYGFKSTGQYGLLPWKEVRAAGLRYQFRLVGSLWSDQANQYSQMQLQAQFGGIGGGYLNPEILYTSAINPAELSETTRDSGWLDYTSTANDGYDIVRLAIYTSADNTGQNTYSLLNLLARIVSP